jgi:hypothetical protein
MWSPIISRCHRQGDESLTRPLITTLPRNADSRYSLFGGLLELGDLLDPAGVAAAFELGVEPDFDHAVD